MGGGPRAPGEAHVRKRFCLADTETYLPFHDVLRGGGVPFSSEGGVVVDGESGAVRVQCRRGDGSGDAGSCSGGSRGSHAAWLYLFKARVAAITEDGGLCDIAFRDLARFKQTRTFAFPRETFAAKPLGKYILTLFPRSAETGSELELTLPLAQGEALGKAIDFLWRAERGRLTMRESVYVSCSRLVDVLSVVALPRLVFPCTTHAAVGRGGDGASQLEGEIELRTDASARLVFTTLRKTFERFNDEVHALSYSSLPTQSRYGMSQLFNHNRFSSHPSLGGAGGGGGGGDGDGGGGDSALTVPIPIEKALRKLQDERRKRRERSQRTRGSSVLGGGGFGDGASSAASSPTRGASADYDPGNDRIEVFSIDLDNVLMINLGRTLLGRKQLVVLCQRDSAGCGGDSSSSESDDCGAAGVTPVSQRTSANAFDARPHRYIFANMDDAAVAAHILRRAWTVNCNSLVTLSLYEKIERNRHVRMAGSGSGVGVGDDAATRRKKKAGTTAARARGSSAWQPTRIHTDLIKVIPDSECFDLDDAGDLLTTFQQTDTDGDYYLSTDEFVASLGPAFNKAAMRCVFRVFDTNGDGAISFPEYLFGIRVLRLGDQDDRISFQHRLFDLNDDGSITLEGFIQTLTLYFTVSPDSRRTLSPRFINKPLSNYCTHIYSLLDSNRTNQVPLSRFREALHESAEVRQALSWAASSSEGGCADSAGENGCGSMRPPAIGKAVVFGSKSWVKVTCILKGIQTAQANRDSLPPTELQVSDCEEKETWTFQDEGGGGGVSGSGGGGIVFADYAPRVFKKLQMLYGTDPEVYLESLGITQLQRSMLCGEMTSLREMSSSSRSGSFFYLSHDSRYVIKTVPYEEMCTFKRSLLGYYTHLKDNPHSLITRITGVHSIQFTDESHKTIFVVMCNAFHPYRLQEHVVYDIKGSTINRSTPAEKRRPGMSLKDLDLLEDEEVPLLLAQPTHDLLMAQIEADAAILRDCGLIDYSILLGIHKADAPLPLPDVANPAAKMQTQPLQYFYGGVPSCSFRQIFYIGIIDIMTGYNYKKKVERYAKTAIYLHRAPEVSCTSPHNYAERFVAFAKRVIQEGRVVQPPSPPPPPPPSLPTPAPSEQPLDHSLTASSLPGAHSSSPPASAAPPVSPPRNASVLPGFHCVQEPAGAVRAQPPPSQPQRRYSHASSSSSSSTCTATAASAAVVPASASLSPPPQQQSPSVLVPKKSFRERGSSSQRPRSLSQSQSMRRRQTTVTDRSGRQFRLRSPPKDSPLLGSPELQLPPGAKARVRKRTVARKRAKTSMDPAATTGGSEAAGDAEPTLPADTGGGVGVGSCDDDGVFDAPPQAIPLAKKKKAHTTVTPPPPALESVATSAAAPAASAAAAPPQVPAPGDPASQAALQRLPPSPPPPPPRDGERAVPSGVPSPSPPRQAGVSASPPAAVPRHVLSASGSSASTMPMHTAASAALEEELVKATLRGAGLVRGGRSSKPATPRDPTGVVSASGTPRGTTPPPAGVGGGGGTDLRATSSAVSQRASLQLPGGSVSQFLASAAAEAAGGGSVELTTRSSTSAAGVSSLPPSPRKLPRAPSKDGTLLDHIRQMSSETDLGQQVAAAANAATTTTTTRPNRPGALAMSSSKLNLGIFFEEMAKPRGGGGGGGASSGGAVSGSAGAGSDDAVTTRSRSPTFDGAAPDSARSGIKRGMSLFLQKVEEKRQTLQKKQNGAAATSSAATTSAEGVSTDTSPPHRRRTASLLAAGTAGMVERLATGKGSAPNTPAQSSSACSAGGGPSEGDQRRRRRTVASRESSRKRKGASYSAFDPATPADSSSVAGGNGNGGGGFDALSRQLSKTLSVGSAAESGETCSPILSTPQLFTGGGGGGGAPAAATAPLPAATGAAAAAATTSSAFQRQSAFGTPPAAAAAAASEGASKLGFSPKLSDLRLPASAMASTATTARDGSPAPSLPATTPGMSPAAPPSGPPGGSFGAPPLRSPRCDAEVESEVERVTAMMRSRESIAASDDAESVPTTEHSLQSCHTQSTQPTQHPRSTRHSQGSAPNVTLASLQGLRPPPALRPRSRTFSPTQVTQGDVRTARQQQRRSARLEERPLQQQDGVAFSMDAAYRDSGSTFADDLRDDEEDDNESNLHGSGVMKSICSAGIRPLPRQDSTGTGGGDDGGEFGYFEHAPPRADSLDIVMPTQREGAGDGGTSPI